MLLVIDSATAACSAALLDADGSVLDERHEIVGRGHAERLAPMVADLLGQRRPGAILVDCGPGSFTGVRVGLALAHGLAIGWGATLRGYSSLALLAAAGGTIEVSAALQGGHGEIFVQDYGGDPLAPLGDLRSLPSEQAACAARAELVIGTGLPGAVLLAAMLAFRAFADGPDRIDVVLDPGHTPSSGGAMSCKPIGSPPAESVKGTDIAGRPR